MGIFKKKAAKPKVQMAQAPEEPETTGEIKHIEGLSNNQDVSQEAKQEVKYTEIPVCMSREQIGNLTIENNIMLKELMAMANEE